MMFEIAKDLGATTDTPGPETIRYSLKLAKAAFAIGESRGLQRAAEVTEQAIAAARQTWRSRMGLAANTAEQEEVYRREGRAGGFKRAAEIISKSMLVECHGHSAPTFCENYGCDDLRLMIHRIESAIESQAEGEKP